MFTERDCTGHFGALSCAPWCASRSQPLTIPSACRGVHLGAWRELSVFMMGDTAGVLRTDPVTTACTVALWQQLFLPSCWMLQLSLIWIPAPFSHFSLHILMLHLPPEWCFPFWVSCEKPGAVFQSLGWGFCWEHTGTQKNPPSVWDCALTTSMDTNSSHIFRDCGGIGREVWQQDWDGFCCQDNQEEGIVSEVFIP